MLGHDRLDPKASDYTPALTKIKALGAQAIYYGGDAQAGVKLAKQAYGFTRTKREGDDIEAINRMFAPEFRNRLDAIITFAHLSREVIVKVVEKFVLQLEAQLDERDVTIELSDEPARPSRAAQR